MCSYVSLLHNYSKVTKHWNPVTEIWEIWSLSRILVWLIQGLRVFSYAPIFVSLVNSCLHSLSPDDKCAVALFHYLDSGHISPQAHFLSSSPLQNSYPKTLVRAYFLYSGSRANVNMVNRTYLWRVPSWRHEYAVHGSLSLGPILVRI